MYKIAKELGKVADKFQYGVIGLKDTLLRCRDLGLDRNEAKEFVDCILESNYYHLTSIPVLEASEKEKYIDSILMKLNQGDIEIGSVVWYLRMQGLTSEEIFERINVMVDDQYNKWEGKKT